MTTALRQLTEHWRAAAASLEVKYRDGNGRLPQAVETAVAALVGCAESVEVILKAHNPNIT